MEDNYLIVLCWFLPYINMNQPQGYVCPLPLELLSLLEAFLILTDGMEGMLLASIGETRVAAEHPQCPGQPPPWPAKNYLAPDVKASNPVHGILADRAGKEPSRQKEWWQSTVAKTHDVCPGVSGGHTRLAGWAQLDGGGPQYQSKQLDVFCGQLGAVEVLRFYLFGRSGS